MISETVESKELDNEWLELIIEAKSLGIEIVTLREFFKNKLMGEQLPKI